MTQETEESPGVRSAMRVTLKTGRRTGVVMIAAGIALAAGMIVLNRGFEVVPVATLLVTAGAGMITGLGAAKAWQAQAEAKQGGS